MKLLFTILFITAFGTHAFLPARKEIPVYPFVVKKTGTGKAAVIFIPGFACSGDVWNETKKPFEVGHTCYTLTMAGFAGVPPQTGATMKSWEDATALFIRENKIDKPIIVGHSLGGVLAMSIAADYPELISKIVVVDALPCLPALMNTGFKVMDNINCGPSIEKIINQADSDFYNSQKRTIQFMLADTSRQSVVINWSMKSDRKTFAAMYCDFSNTDLRDKIAAIKCPALVLLEPYFKSAVPLIDAQYKNLVNADIRYAKKGLHFIMYDDQEWLDKQLYNFINTVH